MEGGSVIDDVFVNETMHLSYRHNSSNRKQKSI